MQSFLPDTCCIPCWVSYPTPASSNVTRPPAKVSAYRWIIRLPTISWNVIHWKNDSNSLFQGYLIITHMYESILRFRGWPDSSPKHFSLGHAKLTAIHIHNNMHSTIHVFTNKGVGNATPTNEYIDSCGSTVNSHHWHKIALACIIHDRGH